MAFEKKVPDWLAEGVEPPESLKESGFTAGYKPPADYFNWFWHGIGEAVKELQSMTPSDIGAAKEEQHKWESYSVLAQISPELTFDSTPFEVANAMPDYSVLSFVTSGTYGYAGGLVPQPENGVLTIRKTTIARVLFEFVGEFSGVYYAYMRSSEGFFSGWLKVYSEKNKPTAEDVGALPLVGGTLTGPVLMKKVDNGYAYFHKNHDVSNDYGTQFSDYDKDGNWFRLYLSALSKRIHVRDSVNNISYELYGQHNRETMIEDIRHHMKLYSGLEQLGLTVGTETIEGIATALPTFSRLTITVGSTNNASIYPNSNNGLLVVEKTAPSRIVFTFTNNNGKQWIGVYAIVTSGNTWTGWKTLTAKDVGALTMELVWENASPSSSFGKQTVALNLADFAGVFIYYKNQNSGSVYYSTGFIGKDDEFTLVYTPSVASTVAVVRKGSVSATGVTFAATSNEDSKYDIPLKIYGIRGVIA